MMRSMIKYYALTVTFVLSLATAASAQKKEQKIAKSDLVVTLTSFRSNEGYANVKLVSLSGKKERTAAIVRIGDELDTKVLFPSLPNGQYMIKMFHDEDGNSRMNRNFANFPTEGYGFSNNKVSFNNPLPNDDECMFTIEEDKELEIEVYYHH